MKDLSGRVAVVTGAASGMGLAFAHKFADEGMSVVLADVESEPLAMAEAALKAKGAKVLGVRTNVLSRDDIWRLADSAFETFGNVHVLCNNAGVGGGTPAPVWEQPLADWEWIFGVNFMGVLHGIQAFVPRMIANGDEGHIVNTASVAGLVGGASPYSVSKHGVVALTEGLYGEFKLRGLRLSASVLCPGWVNTHILEAERNRPEEFGPPTDRSKLPEQVREMRAVVENLLTGGFPPEEIAQQVWDAVKADQFYIIPAQPDLQAAIRRRFEGILDGENPATGPLR